MAHPGTSTTHLFSTACGVLTFGLEKCLFIQHSRRKGSTRKKKLEKSIDRGGIPTSIRNDDTFFYVPVSKRDCGFRYRRSRSG